MVRFQQSFSMNLAKFIHDPGEDGLTQMALVDDPGDTGPLFR